MALPAPQAHCPDDSLTAESENKDTTSPFITTVIMNSHNDNGRKEPEK
jgi:hypothetical protein